MGTTSIDFSTLLLALFGALTLVEAAVLVVFIADLRVRPASPGSALAPFAMWALANFGTGALLGRALSIGPIAAAVGLATGVVLGSVHAAAVFVEHRRGAPHARKAPAAARTSHAPRNSRPSFA